MPVPSVLAAVRAGAGQAEGGPQTVGEGAVVLLLVAAFVAVVVLLLRVQPVGGRRSSSSPGVSPAVPVGVEAVAPVGLAAVVVNPTKFADVEAVREQVTRMCVRHGWAEPLWLETTVADPGQGQTRRALEAGADLVMACGGDGTVRSVAAALAHTGVPMGLLPTGTGNLLARNLDLPLGDLTGAVRTALAGTDRTIDVGLLSVDGGAEEVFLVMAGLGYDALIMHNTQAVLKARMGSAAYVVTGAQHLSGRRVRLTVRVDDARPIHRRSRMVVVGNCGRLLGGLVLMPDAKLDDGLLDVVSLAPKDLLGWATIGARLVTKQRAGHALVERWVGRTVTISCAEPQITQVDGDPTGEATRLRMRVDPGALVVRGPAVAPGPATAR